MKELKEELVALLAQTVAGFARNEIRIEAEEAASPLPVGASKFGGIPDCPPLELREIVEIVAREHPGGITYDDFKYILNKPIKEELTENSTKEAFSVFDKMMKGKIKKEDLKNILLTRGEQNMTEEEIQDLIDHYIEYDENGEVNYNNFVKDTFELFK